MKAPDRLFMFEGYLPDGIRWMESKEGIGEEYIRKGAFPVEEMRAFYERWKDSPGDALGIKFVERILSLLEGE